MSKFDESMAKLLDVTPIGEEDKKLPVEKKQLPATQQLNLEDDLTDAYNQSKDNLQDIIDQGKEAMDEILQIAKAGQHPRAFEVFGGILKNVVDANKELIAMQKQMREMDKKNESSQTNIDKAIFVGSTAELSKFIQGK
ncbi:small terminase protein [uncultured Caudovirales phage]|uniref:Small terminase protein n=1 Tax=uncultured Caudovirales phage TaxID=2100421 RepID=A0A6J5LFM0_9CAUD|nr:small terminase protein [uncultured Caudovirales phage]